MELIGNIPVYTSEDATNMALHKIKTELDAANDGVQTGLLTRWVELNAAVGKYFRFGNSYVICGASGTGKSYLLNNILTDFNRTERIELAPGIYLEPINHKFKDKVITIHFNLEMKAEDEKIRSLSGLLNQSYSYFLCSDFTIEDDKIKYNVLTDGDKSKINTFANKVLSKQNIVYVPNRINTLSMYEVCKYYHKLGYKLVVAIDHMLLVLQDKDDEFKLAHDISTFADIIKKELNALVIILNQMNDNIMESKRKITPSNHYPEMKDGYGGRVLYHGVDTYIFLNRPNRIGIERYGINKFKTYLCITPEIKDRLNLDNNDVGNIYDVIHILVHKNRFGTDMQSIFVLALLSKGKFVKLPIDLLLN